MSTVEGAAAAYAAWIAHGLDPGRIGEYPSRIARVGRGDVERVAKVYLDPKALHVLFMGEDRWLDPSRLGMGAAKVIDIDK
jgi:predicted Zn-dependent peptidase